MSKVQLGARITEDTQDKLLKLVEQFRNDTPIGTVNKQDIVELAIKEMYDKYIKGVY